MRRRMCTRWQRRYPNADGLSAQTGHSPPSLFSMCKAYAMQGLLTLTCCRREKTCHNVTKHRDRGHVPGGCLGSAAAARHTATACAPRARARKGISSCPQGGVERQRTSHAPRLTWRALSTKLCPKMGIAEPMDDTHRLWLYTSTRCGVPARREAYGCAF